MNSFNKLNVSNSIFKSNYNNNTDNGNIDKIKRIATTISNIKETKTGDNVISLSQLETKMGCVKRKFEDFVEFSEVRNKALKDQIAKLEKGIIEDKENSVYIYKTRINYLEELKRRLSNSIDILLAKSRDIENKITSYYNERVTSINEELNKERNNKINKFNDLNIFLDEEIPKLYEIISDKKNKRNNKDTELLRKFKEEYDEITSILDNNKRERIDFENKFNETLKEFIDKTKSEIEGEKKIREENEESLLNLIEDASNKLNMLSQL